MSSHKWFFIINPTSRGGKSKKIWPFIRERLIKEEIEFDFAFTEYHKHSSKLTQGAVCQGFKSIVAIGGDGTFHNVVNGLMSQTDYVSRSINLGIIPVGTGNDWVRTHKIPNQYEQALDILFRGNTKQQDIGRIILPKTEKENVYFNNLAGLGFDGYVVNNISRYKRLGAFAYLIGAISGLFAYKNFEVELRLNKERFQTESLMVVIGLCRYSGGGMQLTDQPNPSDGLFDVSIAKNFSKWDIIKNLTKLFNGKIVEHPLVENYKTDRLSIVVAENNEPFIEADGELIGQGGFNVEIIPKAITFYC